VQLAVVIGLVLLIFAIAAVVVVFEDRRATRREAERRRAWLARLGEVDPLAPGKLRADR
jgi:hypothetical protein